MSAHLDESPRLVTVRTGAPVAEITLGDGTKRNALTSEGWTRLQHCIDELADDPTTRAIVVRGRSGTFCAGSDMTEWVEADLARVEDSFARMEAAFRSVETCPVPVVADVRGVAAGAGCQLALACDLRFMADSARIGMPIARLGINTSPAFAARMTALVGPSLTRRLLYTGTLLDAREAAACGLVDQALAETELDEHVEQVLTAIVQQPPAAVRAAKHAVATALAPARDATDHDHHPAIDAATFPDTIRSLLHR